MIAAIIKHKFRHFDYRVDLFPEETSYKEIKRYYDYYLLGPFELFFVTDQVNSIGDTPKMDIKEYRKKVIEKIDSLTNEEFMELLKNSGIDRCPLEEEEEENALKK